jgi:hypothetical protein
VLHEMHGVPGPGTHVGVEPGNTSVQLW